MAFRTFINYCHCIANTYRCHLGQQFSLPTRVKDLFHLEAALEKKKGVILVSGHLGNWQVGPYLLLEHKLPETTIVMNEEPNTVVQTMEEGWRNRKLRVLYPGRSVFGALEVKKILDRGEMIGLQMDRIIADDGIWIRCGTHDALFSKGPAAFSVLCQAPIVPVFFPFEGKTVNIIMGEPLWPEETADRRSRQHQIKRITQRLASIYLEVIQRYPEQWYNFFQFFKEAGSGKTHDE